MEEKNIPAFQFYPKDFLVDTATLTAEEAGAYTRLLCHCWIQGCLPLCDADLAKLSGTGRRWSRMKNKILKLFHVSIPELLEHDSADNNEGIECTNERVLRHKRLDLERDKQNKFKNKQRKAAESRWQNEHATASPRQCSSSSSSTSVCTEISTVNSNSILAGREDRDPPEAEIQSSKIPSAKQLKAMSPESYQDFLDREFAPYRDPARLEGLRQAYPAIDVVQQLGEAKRWLLTCPLSKRKRAIARFVENWLRTGQHRATFKREPSGGAPLAFGLKAGNYEKGKTYYESPD